VSVRAEVVAAITFALSEPESTLSERFRAVGQLEPTTEELAAARDLLAAASVRVLAELGALTTPQSMLSMNYRQLMRLGWQGRAVLAVADDLSPMWAPWADKPLSDVLKTAPPAQLHRIVELLHHVGLCDLCDHGGGGR